MMGTEIVPETSVILTMSDPHEGDKDCSWNVGNLTMSSDPDDGDRDCPWNVGNV
jgi:hypothetical protein